MDELLRDDESLKDEEYVKIYDSLYNVIGAETRVKVHQEGLLHQVVHLWMSEIIDGECWLYFRKRTQRRHVYPGLYDLIASRHIDPDGTFEDAILENVKDYLGIDLDYKDLTHIGNVRQVVDVNNYHDNALCQVYFCNVEKPQFTSDYKQDVVKTPFKAFDAWVIGQTKSAPLFDRFGEPVKDATEENFWIRKEEYLKVVKPYLEK